MTYDFTTVMDRKGKDALAFEVEAGMNSGMLGVRGAKVREGFSVIPMWVADMNFATVPTVQEAIIERVKHPAFGYFLPSDAYYDAIIDWQTRRNNVSNLTKECIGYENGVLGGLISALGTLCSRGDKVLVHAPTYVGFTHSLEDNGYDIVHSFLKKDADGVWRMDYEDMEAKLRDQHIHAVILCSPHNPTGRVWERWELEKAMALFKKYDVYVVSDEIWSDLTLEDNQHLPTQMVSDDARMRTVALYAPSKTFNLAGLIGAYREEGHIWVDELRQVLSDNVNYAVDYIRTHFDGVSVSKPQGTYMLFIDCSDWCERHHTTIDALKTAGIEVGVIWQDGRAFHGENCIRMNLALPHSLIVEAFDRLEKYVFNK